MDSERSSTPDHTVYRVWWRTQSEDEPPSLLDRWWYMDRTCTSLTLDELVKRESGEELTHLMFEGTQIPTDLPEQIKESIRHLIIKSSGSLQSVSKLMKCLADSQCLESLHIRRVDLSGISQEVLDILVRWKLKHLTLWFCKLTSEVLTSISDMTSLEELRLSYNDLSGDITMSEKLSTLTSLKVLDLSECKLTKIPECISAMTSLEELDMRGNDLSGDTRLSEKLSTLTSLKELYLVGCNLTEIPECISDMTSLEKLRLYGNDLSGDTRLSEKLSTLTSLKELVLPDCNLTEIPECVQSMSHLEKLSVQHNEIEVIPEWIGQLSSLKELGLSNNKQLKKLHNSLLLLPLDDISTYRCYSLLEPPYFVCEGGLENIRQYYTDLNNGSHKITLSTIAVIGRKFAGKTSLVRSLRDKRIVPTYRRDNPQNDASVRLADFNRVDDTTRVFNFDEMNLRSSDPNQEDKIVKVIDFGGDEIYHHAYQLTFRKDCVTVVVVNIIQYEERTHLWGRREATRRVVFDWLSHLYLACPQLDRPLLVITHKDKAGQRFTKLKKELLDTIRELHCELLQEETLDANTVSLKEVGFFLESEIFEVQHGETYWNVFKRIENVIHQRVVNSDVSIPVSWKVIIDTIKDREQSHIKKSELLNGLSGDALKQRKVILDFMKRSGEVLWYDKEDEDDVEEDEEALSNVIFHDVAKITEMIGILFNHSLIDHKCAIVKADLKQMLQDTPPTDDQPLPPDIAILLLTKFNLIYGPTTVNHNPDCYLIPYFMNAHQFKSCRADIDLHGEAVFIGLSIPVYAYQQMTVSFLKVMEQSNFYVHAFGNGASGTLAIDTRNDSAENGAEMIEALLIHEPEQQRVIVRVHGDASQVHRCWKLFLDVIKDLSTTVKKTWPASQIRFDFTCPHCQLLDEPNPEKRSNPRFLMEAIEGRQELEGYRAGCRCRSMTDVPSPLRYPCRELQEIDMQSLVRYIRSIHPDEEQEINRLMGENNDQRENMNPYPSTDPHWRRSYEKVYQMTSTRGRALIINNRDGDISPGGPGRRGSEMDYTLMISMLQRFGFVISHLSRDGDWTSHEIVDAVHQETELLYQGTTSVHEGLGMFVLVMMSHGDTGTILGCDDKHVNLVDIYKLLSSQNFPAMRGKPKLIILPACSGVREVKNEGTSFIGDPVPSQPQEAQNQPQGPQNQPQGPQNQPQGVQQTTPRQATQSPVETNTDTSYQTIDDLLVMKPSFPEHLAYREDDIGAFFIRALVATFDRYAGEKDVRTLSDMIQNVVRKKVRGHGAEREQVPVTISTFTNGRKLYLYPGVNMRTTNHPESFTSEELPASDRQRISLNWRDQYPITDERYALVLYNPENRVGAKAEADKFGQSLKSAGFHLSSVEWKSAHDELLLHICNYIKELRSDCSLLVVSVMSHGRIGMIAGVGDSQVAITDILHQIQTHLAEHIPMVLVVQACQMYRTSGLLFPAGSQAGPSTAIDANRTSPPETKYIELKRPHSVMMLPTVPGGAAVRGAFTGALADEISQADGKTEIHSMFAKASEAISSDSFPQQPVFRSTLRKKLVLPKIDSSACGRLGSDELTPPTSVDDSDRLPLMNLPHRCNLQKKKRLLCNVCPGSDDIKVSISNSPTEKRIVSFDVIRNTTLPPN